VGGCVVISDKAQRMRKWALSWAQYRRRDKAGGEIGSVPSPQKLVLALVLVAFGLNPLVNRWLAFT